MDLICTSCGEPWDLDHVLHEEPEEFERKGALITHCPCCKERTEPLTEAERERLEDVRMVSELLGDDVDGAAAMLEDLGLTQGGTP
jgi:hypothetical protein